MGSAQLAAAVVTARGHRVQHAAHPPNLTAVTTTRRSLTPNGPLVSAQVPRCAFIMGKRNSQNGSVSADSVDPDVPSPARVRNYWLGGTDNFPVDRQLAERIMAAMPSMPLIARFARLFLADSTAWT
jgi:S-adenosyl methyltransferase